MKLELDEVRRITGPNLLWQKPGAMVDVFIDDIDKQSVAECWQKWVQQCLSQFGWPDEKSTYRLHADGANLAISAPMDALYTACEVAELAWDCCASELQQDELPDWQGRLKQLQVELAEEVNPALLELLAAAEQRAVSCLTDDDEVSLGLGTTAEVWPVSAIPAVDEIDWEQYKDIQRAFITGTNGKSTSVRLAAEIAHAAGINAGVTSTDFIKVGDVIIDRGDYSGPGGARMLLRDRRTEMAFLEVARGGILRRGLPVDLVNAALVTNVAADHLGQYGINNVQELAQTKFVVARGLNDKGVLVVNADNELVVAQANAGGKTLCWFSLEQHNPLIEQALKTGERAVFVREGQLTYHHRGEYTELAAVNDVPMTFAGAARHNVQNALGVIGLCRALDLPFAAITEGLLRFSSDAGDNPGRGNVYDVQGSRVIVDFAHNEHSMRAVVDMVANTPANHRIAMFGHAGDRTDGEIRDLTNAVSDLQADHYIITELEDYLRGRELGDMPALVSACLRERGVEDHQIHVAPNPVEGSRLATSLAQPGDLLLLFVLDQRTEVHDYLLSLQR
ncbi:MAG: hypothetical protein KJP04_04795 [Arenicella sp.]|nr:hypothetical protein [Arenicella sp.]